MNDSEKAEQRGASKPQSAKPTLVDEQPERREWQVGLASEPIPSVKHPSRKGVYRFDVELWGKRPPNFQSEVVDLSQLTATEERAREAEDKIQGCMDARGRSEAALTAALARADSLLAERDEIQGRLDAAISERDEAQENYHTLSLACEEQGWLNAERRAERYREALESIVHCRFSMVKGVDVREVARTALLQSGDVAEGGGEATNPKPVA